MGRHFRNLRCLLFGFLSKERKLKLKHSIGRKRCVWVEGEGCLNPQTRLEKEKP